ncbi:calpain-like cysteine peptidase [Trypanosoma rangeli]|uniref:Calpain-like cysteine peptidase n=1 Tax=Trypanosoma rangeli TaxID=5698 RepID=A0A3R7LBJ6_TRYRA|nr:calpain-like cysteine peptidase [Trypanosoma rangeli]RNF11054.1 calpain-like cysteine peptidase [Trypanosoma rangeli]|eukprot:RNF11054.1 calpain-like cysteine peptidase [Trypanosoma rangeli]
MLISVSRHGGKNKKMDCTSTEDVGEPNHQVSPHFFRDVAPRYVFEPQGNPYFVVPRIHNNFISQPYVLGLLVDAYAGNDIWVEFKAIYREYNVFQSIPSFSVKGMMRDVSTGYQILTPAAADRVRGGGTEGVRGLRGLEATAVGRHVGIYARATSLQQICICRCACILVRSVGCVIDVASVCDHFVVFFSCAGLLTLLVWAPQPTRTERRRECVLRIHAKAE